MEKSISGVAIHPDGSHRILTITHQDLTFINVYMPWQCTYCNEEYKDEIDQLAEVTTKCMFSKHIIAGDFNIDLQKHVDSRARYLQNMKDAYQLKEAGHSESPTFKHHNGVHQSKIDYIVINRKWNLEDVKCSKVIDGPENTSTHSCITASLKLTHMKESEHQNSKFKYYLMMKIMTFHVHPLKWQQRI